MSGDREAAVTALVSVETSSTYDLVDLAWDLACAEGVGVTFSDALTDRGEEPCVVAHVIADARPFALVPRPGGAIELWWSQYDAPLERVAVAASLEQVVDEARRAFAHRAASRRTACA